MACAQAVFGLLETAQSFFRISLAQRQMGDPKAEFCGIPLALEHQVFIALLGLVQEPFVVDPPTDELRETRQRKAHFRVVWVFVSEKLSPPAQPLPAARRPHRFRGGRGGRPGSRRRAVRH